MMTTVRASFFSLIMCAGISAFAQEIIEKEYDFKGFSELDVSGSFTVEVTQGNNFKITIMYPQEMKDQIKCSLQGDELNLNMKSGAKFKGYPRAVIVMPELKGVELSGATSINLNDLQGEELDVDISGASSFKGKLSYNTMKMEVSGAAAVEIQGSANNAKLYLSGASNIKGKDFKVAGDFILDCSGASSITMTVDGDMYVELSGASSFDYYGQGNLLKPETSGASEIRKMDN
jgi:hypothetical protein